MKIVSVPHQALRKTAVSVTTVNRELTTFIAALTQTLVRKDNPRGVGLAAPQVDKNLAVFTTLLEDETGAEVSRVFINPTLIDASEELVLGPTKDEARLEGCLSIPGIYGPVPRHQTTKFRFQIVVENELITKTEVFSDFAARVMQHEYDHLNGILFTDYSLRYDLPVYKENDRTKKLEEIDPSVCELF